MAVRLPQRVTHDPRFALAPIEARFVYAYIFHHAEIRPREGDELVATVATLCQGLGLDVCQVVERALPVLVSRGLITREGDTLKPAHATQPRVERFDPPQSWDKSKRAAWRQCLKRARAEDPRVSESALARSFDAGYRSTKGGSSPPLAGGASPVSASPSDVTPGSVTSGVTSPVTGSVVTDGVTEGVTAGSVVTSPGGGLGEKKEDGSFSFSSANSGEETSTGTRAREADATPGAAPVTAPRDVAVTSGAITEEVDAPEPIQLANALRRASRGRLGAASPAMNLRLGQRLEAFGVTVERAQVMGEIAAKGEHYLQDQQPVFPVALLVSARSEDLPVLTSWVDKTNAECERRARATRAPPTTPAARAAAPPARAEPQQQLGWVKGVKANLRGG